MHDSRTLLMKFSTQFSVCLVAGAVLGGFGSGALAGGLQPRGAEFAVTRGIPGDQVNPALALRGSEGVLVWQDASIDGQGLGISAAAIASSGETLAGPPVRVNQTTEGDQENPGIVRLPGNRWFVVWQGGRQGFQNVSGRILGQGAKPVSDEIAISTGNGETKSESVAETLADGSVVVAWSAYRQDGNPNRDVFARILSPEGKPRGAEFRVNSTLGLGRRSPAIAARADGGFVIAWVSERSAGTRNNIDGAGRLQSGAGAPRFEVGVLARAFGADGNPIAGDQPVSEPGAVAANPTLVSLGGDAVLVAWTRRHPASNQSRYDIYSRVINSFGMTEGPEARVNSNAAGDQFRPRTASTRHGVLVIWSSMGQDGSWEGVFGRWMSSEGLPQGDDISVNTQTGGSQILPSVASDDDGGLTVVWSSNMPRSGYELFGQRFLPLKLTAKPRGAGTLRMDWPTLAGGGYQLQHSRDGDSWANVGGPRTANSDTDSVELPASGRMVLYRVIRVR